MLYSALEAYDSGQLAVDGLHTLYYEQCGNPKGKPAVFLHGGPGGGASADARRFWDPARYRIVLFDQRGCGRSKPHAALEHNTTWHLVADIETLRQHLDIERWQVFGGSWGSTLALAYAQTHPAVVTELILRGIFLLRQRDLAWYYGGGAAHIFPDAWADFLAPLSPADRQRVLPAYYALLTHADPAVRRRAAIAWSTWEGRTVCLDASAGFVQRFADPHFAEAFARIECHYFLHGGFLAEEQLLRHVDTIRHIPARIVHGRYDMACPAEAAWTLHRHWPEATLQILPNAGHSAFEPAIAAALVAATDSFAGG